MPVVGEAWYELNARDQKLLGALKRAEGQARASGQAAEQAFGNRASAGMDKTAASATRFGGVMGKATGQAGKFGGVMSNLGMGVLQGVGIAGFMGVTVAASALVGVLGESIGAASDLNETISKTGVVFGASAPAVLEWGKTAATAMGMSEQAALSAASTYGNLFVSMGMAEDKSADMSMSLVQLASDMASFNNVPMPEALDAIRSGLVGETEPLKRFGVNLNETTLKQKAMSLGLADGKGVLDANAKAQAAYAIILEQTATAQGDFARTSDGYANQQRIAQAKVSDAMARMGQAILPIATALIPILADAFLALSEVFTDVTENVAAFIAENQGLFDTLGALFNLIMQLSSVGLSFMAEGFKMVASVVVPAVTTIIDIVKAMAEIVIGAVRNIMEIAAQIPGPWQEAANDVTESLRTMEADLKAVSEKAPKEAAAAVNAGKPEMTAAAQSTIRDPMVDAAVDGAAGAAAEAKKTPQQVAKSLIDGQFNVKDAAEALKDVQKNALSKTKEIAKIEGFLTGDRLAKALNSKKPAVRAEAQAWKEAAEDRLFALKNDVPEIALDTGDDYATALGKKKQEVTQKSAAIAAGVLFEFRSNVARVGLQGRNTGRDYASGIESRERSSKDAGAALARAARSGSKVNATDWGENVGRTYAQGIRNSTAWVKQAARNMAAAQAAILKTSSPAEEGPLSLMGGPEGWGRHFVEGYVEGIESGIPRARRVMGGLASVLMPGTMALNLLPGSTTLGRDVTVRHVIDDPSGSLTKIGTTPNAVAAALAQGLDATGFLSHVRHVASMEG